MNRINFLQTDFTVSEEKTAEKREGGRVGG